MPFASSALGALPIQTSPPSHTAQQPHIAQSIITVPDTFSCPGSEVETLTGVDQLANTIEATHEYSIGGIFVITMTVDDGNGGTDVETTTAIVQGVGVVGGTLYVIGTEGEDKVDIKLKGSDGGPDERINVKGEFDKKGIKVKFDQDILLSEYTINDIVILLCGGDDDAQVHNNIGLDALINGGEGDDKLKGGSGNDTILGGGGDDDLKGYGGDDLLDGGDDDDKLKGGKGNDIMLGGAGNDDIQGGSDGGSDGDGDDILSGGDGDDKLKGGKGMNVLIGGDGEDDLKSGGDGDLFMGGYTSHDNDPVTLGRIRDIWTSGDPCNDKVMQLSGSGGLLEVGTSVFGDDDEDKLEGSKRAADLFFAELGLDDLKGENEDTTIPL